MEFSRELREDVMSGEITVSFDSAMEGTAEATRLHRDRYHAAETIYLAEVRPQAIADLIIDNHDFTRPIILDHRST
ncbi:MAG TPA: hypothetical protein VGA04_12670 [Streptosporangiaceae bacterium]